MDGDRILDAAGELFAHHGVATVDMTDIARAAGCSRATLYRHFGNREALHTAYVRQQARELNRRLAGLVGTITDPAQRLLAALTHALRLVRENPPLAAWFARTPMGAEAAERSDVVQEITTGFLESLGGCEDTARQRARWLVRVLTSLLIVPGRDLDDERDMLVQFVIPLVAPAAPVRNRSGPPAQDPET